MNIDKESIFEGFYFSFLWGGGGWWVPICIRFFYAHVLYKNSSSELKRFYSFNRNKRNNEQVRGITLQSVSEFSQKSSLH